MENKFMIKQKKKKKDENKSFINLSNILNSIDLSCLIKKQKISVKLNPVKKNYITL